MQSGLKILFNRREEFVGVLEIAVAMVGFDAATQMTLLECCLLTRVNWRYSISFQQFFHICLHLFRCSQFSPTDFNSFKRNFTRKFSQVWKGVEYFEDVLVGKKASGKNIRIANNLSIPKVCPLAHPEDQVVLFANSLSCYVARGILCLRVDYYSQTQGIRGWIGWGWATLGGGLLFAIRRTSSCR